MKAKTLAILVFCLVVFGQLQAQSIHSFQRAGGDYSETTATTMNILNPDGTVLVAAGPTGVGQITAATFDPTSGTLYTTHGGGGCCPVTGIAGCLLTSDPDTGATSILACDPIFQGNDNMPGLAANSLGELYGMLLACNAGPQDCYIYLVKVNKITGALTLIGQTGDWDEGNGIAFGAGDVLYFQDNGQGFGSVNLATGQFSPIGEAYVGFPQGASDFRMTDATYDAVNDVFYAAVAYDSETYDSRTVLTTVDTSTGTFTYVNDLPQRTASIAIGGSVSPPTARFKVTKTFSDGSTDDVDVTLTCTTGLPLTQSATITGGDPSGVTFVVTDLSGSVECEVTESGSPAGYTPVFNGGAGCSWVGSVASLNTCDISNAAKPGTFTADMEWNVHNEGGDEVDESTPVTITCDAAIVGGTASGGYWTLSSVLGNGGSLTATVDTTNGSALCMATQSVTISGVESSDDCGSRSIPAGGSSSCTFVNTVFFEGVPTLGQYGLAILALLMLGVGFIGMRRFV